MVKVELKQIRKMIRNLELPEYLPKLKADSQIHDELRKLLHDPSYTCGVKKNLRRRLKGVM